MALRQHVFGDHSSDLADVPIAFEFEFCCLYYSTSSLNLPAILMHRKDVIDVLAVPWMRISPEKFLAQL
jgi:hypothetical protein